ncbi:fatty acyl-AMP ligase [Micromonospora sp. WMMD734]|uniref:fatty acyl-AMP ligase n=1 Tax=Micromonospora sp. WMMD734 TaxID=3404129 RepID=UPI003B96669A
MASSLLHPSGPETRTLPDVLRLRDATEPDTTAYVFLRDGEEPEETLTFRQLHDAATARAARFAALGLTGQRAVLLYPSGLEFIRTLLGCMSARVASAPMQVPRRRDGLARLRRIADDARTTTVLTTLAVKTDLESRFGDAPELAGLALVATDDAPSAPPPPDWGAVAPGPDDIALLQYTSGSTGDPKGVVVTHRHFMHNARETDELWPFAPDGKVVNWLPLFHDMGMLFGVVLPLWAGVPSFLMAPESFIRRPARWLEAIARFGGTHSAAPSFAYELCVRAAAEGGTGAVGDLSRWRVAANGAEPVRWGTLTSFVEAFTPHGFSAEAMCPGYGLAENTLKVTGSSQHRPPKVLWVDPGALADGVVTLADGPRVDPVPAVSCGATVPSTTVRIVDPTSRAQCPPGRVGEIWVSGPCVAGGYWGRQELSEESFRARLLDDPDTPHLRTGDLGFLHDGELYVTGRLKDVIIRKGRNHYPQDIEESAEQAVPGLHPNCAAAFSVDDGTSERLVVLIEVDGRVLRSPGLAAARELVRAAIWEKHRLEADEILMLRRGALSKTSSGKVQRRACRRRYEEGTLVALPVNAVPTTGAHR